MTKSPSCRRAGVLARLNGLESHAKGQVFDVPRPKAGEDARAPPTLSLPAPGASSSRNPGWQNPEPSVKLPGLLMKAKWSCALLAWLLPSAPVLAAAELVVNFAQTNGAIRALHGVNAGPLCSRGLVDLSAYHQELSLPLARLHDVPWGNFEAVDISTIFRDFRNDAADPASYSFAQTDDYLAATLRASGPVLYRLGESIEHTPHKYRVHPPADFAKWSEIASNLIRHCNEGWAGGFHHGIRYWEIWNEPDNKPAMWTGTDEQFLAFYATAATTLKKRWPELRVGGPGLANAGRFQNGKFKPSAYLLRFLKHCRENQVPLDFLSWHRYTKDPSEFARLIRSMRQVLDAEGFTRTESHLNEWNYLPRDDWKPLTTGGQGVMRDEWLAEMHGPRGAAFAAWTLISFQGEPLNMANFFTSDNQVLGMFNANGVPEKNFYAFKAFRALLDTPRRVQTPPCGSGKPAVCAGLNQDNTRAAILLSSFFPGDDAPTLALRGLPWQTPSWFDVYLVNESHSLDKVRSGVVPKDAPLPLPEAKAPAVVLLQLAPATPSATSSKPGGL